MKNIITIAIILILPILVYLVMNKTSNDVVAFAQDNSKPTLLIFSSTMCMDCQKMKTILNEIQPTYSDKVNFVQINATENSKSIKDIVKKYSVVLVPTIVFVNEDSNETGRIEGYIPKEDLIKEVEAVING